MTASDKVKTRLRTTLELNDQASSILTSLYTTIDTMRISLTGIEINNLDLLIPRIDGAIDNIATIQTILNQVADKVETTVSIL